MSTPLRTLNLKPFPVGYYYAGKTDKSQDQEYRLELTSLRNQNEEELQNSDAKLATRPEFLKSSQEFYRDIITSLQYSEVLQNDPTKGNLLRELLRERERLKVDYSDGEVIIIDKKTKTTWDVSHVQVIREEKVGNQILIRPATKWGGLTVQTLADRSREVLQRAYPDSYENPAMENYVPRTMGTFSPLVRDVQHPSLPLIKKWSLNQLDNTLENQNALLSFKARIQGDYTNYCQRIQKEIDAKQYQLWEETNPSKQETLQKEIHTLDARLSNTVFIDEEIQKIFAEDLKNYPEVKDDPKKIQARKEALALHEELKKNDLLKKHLLNKWTEIFSPSHPLLSRVKIWMKENLSAKNIAFGGVAFLASYFAPSTMVAPIVLGSLFAHHNVESLEPLLRESYPITKCVSPLVRKITIVALGGLTASVLASYISPLTTAISLVVTHFAYQHNEKIHHLLTKLPIVQYFPEASKILGVALCIAYSSGLSWKLLGVASLSLGAVASRFSLPLTSLLSSIPFLTDIASILNAWNQSNPRKTKVAVAVSAIALTFFGGIFLPLSLRLIYGVTSSNLSQVLSIFLRKTILSLGPIGFLLAGRYFPSSLLLTLSASPLIQPLANQYFDNLPSLQKNFIAIGALALFSALLPSFLLPAAITFCAHFSWIQNRMPEKLSWKQKTISTALLAVGASFLSNWLLFSPSNFSISDIASLPLIRSLVPENLYGKIGALFFFIVCKQLLIDISHSLYQKSGHFLPRFSEKTSWFLTTLLWTLFMNCGTANHVELLLRTIPSIFGGKGFWGTILIGGALNTLFYKKLHLMDNSPRWKKGLAELFLLLVTFATLRNVSSTELSPLWEGTKALPSFLWDYWHWLAALSTFVTSSGSIHKKTIMALMTFFVFEYLGPSIKSLIFG